MNIVKGTRAYKFIIKQIKVYLRVLDFRYNLIFNDLVKRQLDDPSIVPFVIISFNQLYYLEQLVDRLKRIGHKKIVIIDNASSYKPLLEYLNMINGGGIEVYFLKVNYGHLSFWNNPDLVNTYAKGFYILTDADILPLETCPDDFVQYSMQVLLQNKSYTKVGLSLDIENIPDSYKFKSKVIQWEKKFWTKEVRYGYRSKIDTTMALYKPGYNHESLFFLKAIRLKRPYTAIHGGWLIDYDNLTKEQEYFIKTANASSSWASKDGINVQSGIYNKKKAIK